MSNVKIQFIASEQFLPRKCINWKTKKIKRVKKRDLIITLKQKNLIKRGLLHVNSHHNQDKLINHPRLN